MRTLAIITALLLSTRLLPAQVGRTGPLLLHLPGSTRAAAMGGAYPIAQTESDAIFYNPAVSERLRGASLALQRYGNASTLYTASAAGEWLHGAVGFGVAGIDYAPAIGDGGAVVPATPVALFLSGPNVVSEHAILLSYGQRIKKLRVAATGKFLEQRSPGERHATVAGDVAAAATLLIPVGLSVQNIGPGVEYQGDNVPLPLRVALDASMPRSIALGPFDVFAASRLAWTREGHVSEALGVELGYYPISGRTFTVRAGLRNPDDGEKPYTLGAGFAGDRIVLEYAFIPYDAGHSHRFGIRWR